SGRTDEDLDDLVGIFVNNLVLRLTIPTDITYSALLARSRQCMLEAMEHQDVPFEFLVDALNPTRSLPRNPLFQTALTVQNSNGVVWDLPGISVESVRVGTNTAKFDLAFFISQEWTS